MTLSDNSRLDIAQITFFFPAFLVSLFVCLRHGFTRQAGWIFLAILSAIRIAGASCDLAARQGASDPVDLEIAALVLGGVGLSFLISVLSCVLQRVNNGMATPVLAPRFIRFIHLPLLVGVILGIVAGNDESHYTNPSEVSNGQTLAKAAIILFLLSFVAVLGLLFLIVTHLNNVQKFERRLVFAVAVAVPFLFVRLLYTLLQDFEPRSKTFGRTDPNFWVRTFMDVVMEFVVVLIMLVAGLVTPSSSGQQSRRENSGNVALNEGVVQ